MGVCTKCVATACAIFRFWQRPVSRRRPHRQHSTRRPDGPSALPGDRNSWLVVPLLNAAAGNLSVPALAAWRSLPDAAGRFECTGWRAAGSAAGGAELSLRKVMRRRWVQRLRAFPRQTLRLPYHCARSLLPPSLLQRPFSSRRPQTGTCLRLPSPLFRRPMAARPWLRPLGP